MGLGVSGLVTLVIVVAIVSELTTRLVRALAGRLGWMAMPREDRWHKMPTALRGGLGFYPVFLGGALWITVPHFMAVKHLAEIQAQEGQELRLIAAMLLGSLIMFVVGLWDDLKHFRPATKLLAQLVAASLIIGAGGVFPLTGSHVTDVLVTYFWFIGITNAINMLDNMDGLASGVVIIAGITLIALMAGVSGSVEQAPIALQLAAVFIASLAGFWVHNRPPATIFMGDSGSLFLGYTLAALAVPTPLNAYLGIQTGEMLLGPVLALLIPATVLAVPIFDTTLVTITRTWRAQKASQGGQDHASHRLVGLGLAERTTVWVLYGFAALGGTVAVLMQRYPAQAWPLLGGFILILCFVGVYLGHVKVQSAAPESLPPAWTPLVAMLFYKRRAAEVLLDTILVVLCFYGAYLLRFDGMLAVPMQSAMRMALPMVVASCMCIFFLAGIYRGQWRLFSISDLPTYAVAVSGGTTLSLAIVTLVTRFDEGHSRSVYIIFGVLAFLTMVGSRLSYRVIDALLVRIGGRRSLKGRRPVLIYGAGKSGKMLFEEILSNPELREYVVIGFIDDDIHKIGRTLCGVPVRAGEDWAGCPMSAQPEVWISSRFVDDQRAFDVTDHWHGPVTIRRVQLRLVVVEPQSDKRPFQGHEAVLECVMARERPESTVHDAHI